MGRCHKNIWMTVTTALVRRAVWGKSQNRHKFNSHWIETINVFSNNFHLGESVPSTIREFSIHVLSAVNWVVGPTTRKIRLRVRAFFRSSSSSLGRTWKSTKSLSGMGSRTISTHPRKEVRVSTDFVWRSLMRKITVCSYLSMFIHIYSLTADIYTKIQNNFPQFQTVTFASAALTHRWPSEESTRPQNPRKMTFPTTTTIVMPVIFYEIKLRRFTLTLTTPLQSQWPVTVMSHSLTDMISSKV